MEFKKTNDAKVAALYNGFIDKEGIFYIVSEKSGHKPTHEEWSVDYVTRNTNYISLLLHPTNSLLFTVGQLKSKVDLLIHFYGFIYYSHDQYTHEPIIICPDYEINNIRITRFQEYMLYEIMKANNELDYFPFDNKVYVDEEKHNAYVDRFICKRLNEEIKK